MYAAFSQTAFVDAAFSQMAFKYAAFSQMAFFDLANMQGNRFPAGFPFNMQLYGCNHRQTLHSSILAWNQVTSHLRHLGKKKI